MWTESEVGVVLWRKVRMLLEKTRRMLGRYGQQVSARASKKKVYLCLICMD